MGSVSASLKVGRYALYGVIARGGMATVHFGRLLGSAGFSRTVAIKRLHPHFATDAEFVNMFLDESRLAGRIHHPNVVQTLDAVLRDGELFLVMEYLDGESLARLAKTARDQREPVPLPVVSAILCGALHGLHAAHEATDERGVRLDVVHRDVSPHNILVGADGVPRVIDFGVARAVGRLQMTMEGQIKGKVAYMPPEQLLGQVVDPRADVYAAGAVLWEMLTGQRLFDAETHAAVITAALMRPISSPRDVVPEVPQAVSDIAMRALDRNPEKRFATAREMALAIEACVPVASPTQVGAWVTRLAGDATQKRAQEVLTIENDSGGSEWPSASAVFLSTEQSGDRPRALSQSGTLSRGSSISLLPEPPKQAKSERRLGGWVAGAAAVLLAISAVTVGRSRGSIRTVPNPAVAARTLATAPSPTQTTIPTPSVAGTPLKVAAPLTPPVPDAAAPLSLAAAPSNPPEVEVEALRASPPTRPPRGAAPAPGRTGREPAKSKPCSVTTYIDDDGFTHFSKECR